MKVLLVSTYELGHQPLHLAAPAGALTEAGHEVRTLDLSVEDLAFESVEWADRVAISVPMHTAMRLGVALARRVKEHRPDLPLAFYGLYATVASDDEVRSIADIRIAGEYEEALVEWVSGKGSDAVRVELGRTRHAVPARDSLPPLGAYAKFRDSGTEVAAGYVEATHGCRHRCRHCPLPTIYDGRLRIVAADIVVADAVRQVEAGAQHLTFGDPDFLNAPVHAIRTLEGVRAAVGDVSVDVTVKVSHILDHADLWPTLRSLGVRFVVSAFEQADDRLLELLDKGHTVTDMSKAVTILRDAGIDVRPTWLPFTPWTKPAHLAQIVRFVDESNLWGSVDPIQLAIRLLIPDGSLMLDLPELGPHLRGYDPEMLGFQWVPADPQMDALQRELAAIVEEGDTAGTPDLTVMRSLVDAIGQRTGIEMPAVPDIDVAPRLTESWFCCAEPTARQLNVTS